MQLSLCPRRLSNPLDIHVNLNAPVSTQTWNWCVGCLPACTASDLIECPAVDKAQNADDIALDTDVHAPAENALERVLIYNRAQGASADRSFYLTSNVKEVQQSEYRTEIATSQKRGVLKKQDQWHLTVIFLMLSGLQNSFTTLL